MQGNIAGSGAVQATELGLLAGISLVGVGERVLSTCTSSEMGMDRRMGMVVKGNGDGRPLCIARGIGCAFIGGITSRMLGSLEASGAVPSIEVFAF